MAVAVYVFPGIGLGATVAGAKTITDRMLYVAAETLANFVSDEELSQGKVFPHINNIRKVSHKVAVSIVKEAIKDGQATTLSEQDKSNLDDFVDKKMYYPEYTPLIERREVTI